MLIAGTDKGSKLGEFTIPGQNLPAGELSGIAPSQTNAQLTTALIKRHREPCGDSLGGKGWAGGSRCPPLTLSILLSTSGSCFRHPVLQPKRSCALL